MLRRVVLGAGLVVALLVCYRGVWHAGFIWDDDAHLTASPCIVGPLGLQGAWTTPAGNYFPLVLTHFWVLHAIWGLDPLPYHLVNLLLHLGVALLLWNTLAALRVRGAWLGAAIWSLHPVQAESVAWISEFTNTQSALFFLLSIRAFIAWVRRHPEARRFDGWYALACVSAAAAVTSKPSTVMLPAVLVLCAWWLRVRWRWRDALWLLPFLAAAGAMSVWTVWEQRFYSGALGREWDFSLAARVVIAGKALWFYLGKLLWPNPLIFVYPRWNTAGFLAWTPFLAGVALLAALARARGLRARPAKFAAGYFLLLLFPVLGFFNVYFYRYSFVADHFQYLASIGPCALVGAAVAAAAEASRRRWRAPIYLTVGPAGVALAATTAARVPAFASDTALWENTLRGDPNCWMAHNNLAVALAHVPGREAEAVWHCQRALELNPGNAETQYNYATWLDRVGRREEAIGHYRIALRLTPGAAQWHARLAEDLVRSASTRAEGRRELREALRLDPNLAEAHYNLGTALAEDSPTDPQAIAEFREAIRLRPDYAEAHFNLGNSYSASGRGREATAEYEAALRARPTYARAHWALADALVRDGGEVTDAISHYAAALQNGPDDTRLRTNYAIALFNAGRRADAIAQLQAALRLDPGNRAARDDLRSLGAPAAP